MRYRHADGATVTVRCRGMAIRMLGVHNDETAPVRQRDEAQASSAMKSTFVANLSHEIRTPLNVVLGASELLAAGDMSCRQRELIASIESGRQPAAPRCATSARIGTRRMAWSARRRAAQASG